MNLPKNICICLNDVKAYSETFIQSHVDHLDAKLLYVSMLPSRQVKDYTAQNSSIAGRLKQFLKKSNALVEDGAKKKRLRNFMKKESIGVVMAEYGQAGVAVLQTCKENNIPLVVHFHGFDAYKKDVLNVYRNDYSELFDYATAIIAVSKDMERQLISLGAPAQKIHYNVYGVDVLKFKKNDIRQSGKKLLFVGRFVEKKAPYLAILAFNKALASVPDATFVMAGDGLLLDVCKNMVRALKIEDKITFTGALTHHEVTALMQSCRAYVQHSIVPGNGDSEGTPNSVLEAQACGIPVIATKHAGIKDVIIDGETGFLCEEGDIDEMAAHMVMLLQDTELASRMGKNAVQNAMNNFTLESSISKLRLILKNCIRQQG